MPGTITPLPVMLEDEQRKLDAVPQPPKSVVVRYGYMKLIAEFPYDGKTRTICGAKLVLRTPRDIEIGELVTTSCGNGGCGLSVIRKQMLQHIDNTAGGRGRI